jgi:hypothetical protein
MIPESPKPGVVTLDCTAPASRSCGIVATEANTGVAISVEELEKMARRRFQSPKPERQGKWWTLRFRRDHFVGGNVERNRVRIRLAPATMSEREVRKIAAEHLRSMNQGLETIGSAMQFDSYVESTYIPVAMPLLAKTARGTRASWITIFCPLLAALFYAT